MRSTHVLTPADPIRKFSRYDTAAIFVAYHRGDHEWSDKAAVTAYLRSCVKSGYLTKAESDELAMIGVMNQRRLI